MLQEKERKQKCANEKGNNKKRKIANKEEGQVMQSTEKNFERFRSRF